MKQKSSSRHKRGPRRITVTWKDGAAGPGGSAERPTQFLAEDPSRPGAAQVHTVVDGGMSGWQIALIAAGAALLGRRARGDRRPGHGLRGSAR